MEAKCFLSRAYKLHREIQIKKEQLASIRESLSSITNPIDKEHVSHTPDSSPMENALLSLIELENEVQNDAARFVEIQKETVRVINQLADPTLRLILSKRYVCFKTWQVIADEINLSEKRVFNQHNCGLKKVEEILDSMEIPNQSD